MPVVVSMSNQENTCVSPSHCLLGLLGVEAPPLLTPCTSGHADTAARSEPQKSSGRNRGFFGCSKGKKNSLGKVRKQLTWADESFR